MDGTKGPKERYESYDSLPLVKVPKQFAWMCPQCYRVFKANVMGASSSGGLIHYSDDIIVEPVTHSIDVNAWCPYCYASGVNGDPCEEGEFPLSRRKLLANIDYRIVDIIAELNRKGYRTEYCCEGHVELPKIAYMNNSRLYGKRYREIEDFVFGITCGYIKFFYDKMPPTKEIGQPKYWHYEEDGETFIVLRYDPSHYIKSKMPERDRRISKHQWYVPQEVYDILNDDESGRDKKQAIDNIIYQEMRDADRNAIMTSLAELKEWVDNLPNNPKGEM